ncbi:hypothetical protein EV702DRAFT_1272626 [Suillus placidus]|uniref:Uncharacterized protein n=1 Tax=Suillus placidus TaxID=48579 RepID=A0A9P6ZH51_9AGAM|nr:hypothetical protein EV702DRAFT_1272626 [Suillus placidus]
MSDAETDDAKATTPARTIAEEKRIWLCVLGRTYPSELIHRNPDAKETLTNLFQRADVVERVIDDSLIPPDADDDGTSDREDSKSVGITHTVTVYCGAVAEL